MGGRGGCWVFSWLFHMQPFWGEHTLAHCHLSGKCGERRSCRLFCSQLLRPCRGARQHFGGGRRSAGEQRCAHRPGGGRWAVRFKGARRFCGRAVRLFKSRSVVFLSGISACRRQWRLETGRSRHLTTGVFTFPLFFPPPALCPPSRLHTHRLPFLSIEFICVYGATFAHFSLSILVNLMLSNFGCSCSQYSLDIHSYG